jgi:hypothetical protein
MSEQITDLVCPGPSEMVDNQDVLGAQGISSVGLDVIYLKYATRYALQFHALNSLEDVTPSSFKLMLHKRETA